MKPRKTINNGYPCWVVQFTEHGKRVKVHRKTKADIDAFIRDHKAKKEKLSQDGLKLMGDPDIAHSVYKALEHIKGKNYDLMDVILFYENHFDTNDKSIKISEGVKKFISYKEGRGKRQKTIAEYTARLGSLVDFIGTNKPVSSVTIQSAKKWIEEKKVAPRTKDHFRRVGSAFFNWCVQEGYTDINPFEKIQKYSVNEDKPVEVFSFDQIQKLLDNCQHEQSTLWIAIGAFAGIRPTEMNRLTWDLIHLDRGEIDLLGEIAKKRNRRQVDIQPRLMEILKKYHKKEGPIFSNKDFGGSKIFKDLKSSVDFDWIDDGLRHSFGSHYIAAFENIDKTILQMGHNENSQVFKQHYYKPGISKEEGKKYFGIIN